MRNLMLAFTLIVILIFSGIIIINVENKTTRQNELEKNLSLVLEETLEAATIDSGNYYNDITNDQLVDLFKENLLIKLNSEADLDIEILAADINKGILSAKVTETYSVLGREKTITVKKTAVKDSYDNNSKNEYKVTFYDSYDSSSNKFVNILKQVSIDKGKELNANPKPTTKAGYVFKGWALYENGTKGKVYTNTSSYTVTKKTVFVAEYEKKAGNIYTVSLCAENKEIESIDVTENSIIGTHKSAPSKSGYTFKGWSSTDKELLSDSQLSEKKVKRNIRYTAKYQKN